MGDRRHVVIWVAAAIVMGVQSTSATAHTMAKVETELIASERHAELLDQHAPQFSLQDLDGQTVSLSDFRGRVVLLNFVEARCRGACPSQSALIAKVQALLAAAPRLGEQMKFVSVATGTDDAVETAAIMRKGGLDTTDWIFLRGRPHRENEGFELSKAYGLDFVRTNTGEQMLEAVTHVIDPEGRLRARFHGLEFNPVRLMIYAAALAHGDHALVVEEVARPDGLDRRLLFGAVASGVGLLVAFAWIAWLRRND